MTTQTNYQQQAIDFANKYGVTLKIGQPKYGDHFKDGTNRWVFPCVLSRNNKQYSFKFGQSIASGKEAPTMYDILACMTKYDPYSYEDFCASYGYEMNKGAYHTYLSVVREYEGMCRLFDTDILEEMQDIN